MNWLHYLLEANLYLVVFYTGYCLFLNKETYYTLNRAYLLLSCILSFLLPIIQIGALKPVESGIVNVVLLAPSGLKSVTTEDSPVSFLTRITVDDVLLYTYLLGVLALALILIFKIFRLIKMTRTAIALVDNKYKLIGIDGSNTAFSFFNYLFIGTKTAGSDIIIRHELVHIRQKHSADIIFMELIKIINWFNPFIYLMQVSLKTVHEYIADEQTAAHETDALAYSSFLVNNAYGLNGSSITHSFFNYNLLKKRIIMLNQKRSGNLARLKYLMTVPICAAALCASTLGFSKTYALIDLAPQHDAADSANKVKSPTQKHLSPPPPPIAIKNEYTALYEHLSANIKYPANEIKNNRSGLVIVGFNISSDHKLSNAKIVKSTDKRFDSEALKAFQSFNGTIADKAGEHKIAISFYTDYYTQAPQYEADVKQSGVVFNMYVVVPPPPPPSKVGSVPPAVKKPTYIGKNKMPPPPPPAKVKKGVKVIDVVISPPPVDEPTQPVPVQAPGEAVPPPPPPKDPFEDLHKYIAKYTRYPTAAHNNHIGGRVIAEFTINNGKINDVKITRGIDQGIDAEVLRVLKNFTGSVSIKSGNYAMPISFALVDKADKQVAHAPDNYTNKAVAANAGKTAKPTYMLNEVVIVGYANN